MFVMLCVGVLFVFGGVFVCGCVLLYVVRGVCRACLCATGFVCFVVLGVVVLWCCLLCGLCPCCF